MADDLSKLGEFSEQGRGLPVWASRPAGALPFSPLVRQAYAPSPRARLGWAQGVVPVSSVALEPPRAIPSTARPAEAAARMLVDDSDFVPVVDDGRFTGAVYIEQVLRCVAGDQTPSDVKRLISTQIPTCGPNSSLVDAVRQMLACFLRRIPVVGDRGELLGLLTLAAAAHAGDRDPSVRDILAAAVDSPSLFAHRWR